MTIVAAIDFSDVTASVIDAAVERAQGEAILLIHVAPADPEYVSYRVGPEKDREEIAGRLRELRDRLHREAERLETRGHAAETLLVQGDVAARIVEQASRREASLIVVGRHRHGRLHDRLVGTEAEAVLRASPCPVLVVPPAVD